MKACRQEFSFSFVLAEGHLFDPKWKPGRQMCPNVICALYAMVKKIGVGRMGHGPGVPPPWLRHWGGGVAAVKLVPPSLNWERCARLR